MESIKLVNGQYMNLAGGFSKDEIKSIKRFTTPFSTLVVEVDSPEQEKFETNLCDYSYLAGVILGVEDNKVVVMMNPSRNIALGVDKDNIGVTVKGKDKTFDKTFDGAIDAVEYMSENVKDDMVYLFNRHFFEATNKMRRN